MITQIVSIFLYKSIDQQISFIKINYPFSKCKNIQLVIWRVKRCFIQKSCGVFRNLVMYIQNLVMYIRNLQDWKIMFGELFCLDDLSTIDALG